MNNKFDHFLEDNPPKRERSSHGQPPLIAGDTVSIKVRAKTLSRLKLLKTFEGHRSYAEVIEELLDSYLDHAGSELREKLDLLKS